MARSKPDGLLERVRTTLVRFGVSKADSIVVGVSGGVDSMTLLQLLHTLNSKGVFRRLVVAHVDHGLRGDESDADRQLVLRTAIKYKLECFVEAVDINARAASAGVGIEEAARDERYSYFRDIAEHEKIAWVATAHHGGDVLETLLMNIVRGTGLRGLAGMPANRPLSSSVTLIRPLLGATRDEITVYARKHRIRWREDSSNSSDVFTRNRIRHRVIPELEKAMPGRDLDEAVRRLTTSSTEVLDFLRQCADELGRNATIKTEPTFFVSNRATAFRLDVLRNTSPVVVRELLIDVFARMRQPAFVPDTRTWNRIWAMIQQGKPAALQITAGLRLSQRDNILLLEPSIKAVPLQATLAIGETLTTEIGTLSLRRTRRSATVTDPNRCMLPATLVQKNGLSVRIWKPADRIKPFGMKGSKLVSDLLSEAGVKTEAQKRRFPLVVLAHDPNIVVWVPGIRASEICRIAGRAETAVLLERKLS
ncbi:MAG: tRNA lysidine(34) synthetase TilS [Bacteroidetes bacterium]|nr:tRNA lysidine(34) synthetase TilS [Bacteroidota bacterium]